MKLLKKGTYFILAMVMFFSFTTSAMNVNAMTIDKSEQSQKDYLLSQGSEIRRNNEC